MADALSIIAVSIAGLTFLWTIAWSIYTHRAAMRPRIVVSAGYVLTVPVGVPCIGVTVVNSGPVPATISGVQFAIRDRSETLAILEWLVETPRPLPAPLGRGEHWYGLVEMERLSGSLQMQYGPATSWHVRPVARDPAGGTYPAERWLDVGGDAA